MLVPFGRGNRSSEALILSLGVGVPDKPLKTVRSLLDEEPVVSDKEIRLALWMRQRYFCTFYDALHTILPAAVWYRYRELWRMADGVLPEGLPEKEAAVCRLLEDGPMETDTLKQALGDDVAPLLRRMEKAGKLRRETESRRKVRDKVDLFVKLAVPADQALEMVGKTARRQREVVAFLPRTARRGCMIFAISPARPARPWNYWPRRHSVPAGAGDLPNYGKTVYCKGNTHYTE